MKNEIKEKVQVQEEIIIACEVCWYEDSYLVSDIEEHKAFCENCGNEID